MYMNEDKNDGKAFEKVCFETDSKHWFVKLLRLTVYLVFVKTELFFLYGQL